MFSLHTKISMAKAVLTKNSPFYVAFMVSNRCFLHCQMCNVVQSNKDTDLAGLDKIEMIAKNLRAIGGGVVVLTGGEPFMRPEMTEIVKIFKSYSLDIRLQTAGFISRFDTMLECAKAGARDINVSLDSLDEGLCDYINGVKGSWNTAIRTIARINREFPGKDTICALNAVLSPLNLRHIEAVLDFATAIGWWLAFSPVHITRENGFKQRGTNEKFIFRPEQYSEVDEVIERLKQRKKEGANLYDSYVFLESVKEFVRTGKTTWRKGMTCDSPNLYFMILPDGSLAPCGDYYIPEKIFVYNKDFPNRYKSGEIRSIVRRTIEHCPGCNYNCYPEMTMTIRSPKALWERVMLSQRCKFMHHIPYSDQDAFALIDGIKDRHHLAPFVEEGTAND